MATKDEMDVFKALETGLDHELSGSEFQELLRCAVYDGFDPQHILGLMHAKWKKKGGSDFVSDLCKCFLLILAVGTTAFCSSSKKGVNKEAQTQVKHYMALFGIVDGAALKSKAGDNSDKVVPSRVLACCVPKISDCMDAEQGARRRQFYEMTAYSKVECGMNLEEYPAKYRFPGANALFADEEDDLHEKYITFMVEFGRFILKPAARAALDMKEHTAEVRKFADVTWQNRDKVRKLWRFEN
jgi:hypothetical protein